jgi:hypothetical protein
VKPDPCPHCNANRNVVGKVHRCLPLQIAAERPIDADVANDVANTDGMANRDMANGSAANRAGSTYRYRNADSRRLYQRDLMRRRRAEGPAA